APAQMMEAVEIYRRMFRPSEQMEKPYVMLGINVFAADTEEEARRVMTSVQQSWVQLRRGNPIPLPPPIEGYEAALEHALACSVIGSPEMVRQGLEEFAERTGADELMVVSQIYDHAARLRSYEIASGG
ncbi:MAG TPA: LLM class flavin-dependent oxidoreductase, partial [Thermoanaerobaculia bacterium]|nr:LLM class flavin-dependent oxidoreductase [Thermoanaerobaculia bacterium]